MGAGSFKEDVSGLYESCVMCDDGSVAGAAGAAWSLVNCFLPGCIMFIGYIPGYLTGGDHVPFLCAAIGCFVMFWPAAVVFLALLVPGAVAAGCGALYGLARGGPCRSEKSADE